MKLYRLISIYLMEKGGSGKVPLLCRNTIYFYLIMVLKTKLKEAIGL